MPQELPDAFLAYAGLSTPAVITDADYRIVYLNPRAEAYWATTPEAFSAEVVSAALSLEAPAGRYNWEWFHSVLYRALTIGDAYECLTTAPGGRPRGVSLSGTRFWHAEQWYFVLTVVPESEQGTPSATVAWALRDPLTGLFNRHQWQSEFAMRDSHPGSVVFFDLDGLKNLNDLAGHTRGDQALIVVAAALTEHAPADALAVRFAVGVPPGWPLWSRFAPPWRQGACPGATSSSPRATSSVYSSIAG